ncbi:unnamed protein product [Knipowitschia caucasica]
MEKHSKANNSKHKKMKGQAIEKSPHTKNHNQNHFHKHSDNESHDTHSTEEDCVFNDPPRDRRHHRSRFDRQSHRSFSTSSTSITSSSSTSSVSSSSVSTSSPSTSSTSSTSSPSSSSDTDSDSSSPRVEPRHYRSCTDIPKKERYFDECDDTAPLLAKGEHVERNQKQDSVPKHGSSQGKCKISRDGNVRKAKSMESLARTQEKEPQDDAEQEKRSNEARKNIVKEKIKFSAFLNEITRQNSKDTCKAVQIQQAPENTLTAALSIHTLTKGTIVTGQKAHQIARGAASRGIIHGIAPAHHQTNITVITIIITSTEIQAMRKITITIDTTTVPLTTQELVGTKQSIITGTILNINQTQVIVIKTVSTTRSHVTVTIQRQDVRCHLLTTDTTVRLDTTAKGKNVKIKIVTAQTLTKRSFTLKSTITPISHSDHIATRMNTTI